MINAPALAAVQICDDLGNCINGPARRIVSLYGSFNEILLAIGAERCIIARTTADANIDRLAHLPEIGTHMRPNLELILATKPEAVLQAKGRREADLFTESLKRFDIPILAFEISSFDQLFKVTAQLGQLTEKEKEARTAVSEWQSRLAKLLPPQKKPVVYFEAREPELLAAGNRNMANAIIEAAGGINLINSDQKFQRFNEEMLLLKNPDFCISQKGPMNPDPRPISERPNLKNLKCAKPGRHVIVDEQEFSRPGPRNIDAAEKLAHWLKDL